MTPTQPHPAPPHPTRCIPGVHCWPFTALPRPAERFLSRHPERGPRALADDVSAPGLGRPGLQADGKERLPRGAGQEIWFGWCSLCCGLVSLATVCCFVVFAFWFHV